MRTTRTQSRPSEKPSLDKRVVVTIGPREDTIAAKWNRALAENADLYLVAADDDPYVTEGYDAKAAWTPADAIS
jgi:hypothetical protein